MMKSFDPNKLSVPEVHKLLLGGVAPRPIALVSTVSEDGINNLAPFSFFNAFGANPPIVAFSANRRGRDGTLKDTYNNIIATGECVIQAVTYSMVEQVSLASTEYPPGTDEFVKSGLTPIDSELVKPKRVKESPFQMECKLIEMKSFGSEGASANLAICRVLKFHVDEFLFSKGIIDPKKYDVVARMSANYYSRAAEGVFKVEKPIGRQGIGYDQLPDFIKQSTVYTANNLAKLANAESLPSQEEIDLFIEEIEKISLDPEEISEHTFFTYKRLNDYKKMLKSAFVLKDKKQSAVKKYIELTAQCALENNDVDFAWKAALTAEKF